MLEIQKRLTAKKSLPSPGKRKLPKMKASSQEVSLNQQRKALQI